MINVSELRIGNLAYKSLKSGNGRTIIDKISGQDMIKLIEITSSFNYEPIELTAEMLISFDFDEKPKGFYSIKCGSTYFRLTPPKFMGEWQDEYCWVYDEFKFTEVKYVHQLQNLYFILCGVELQLSST